MPAHETLQPCTSARISQQKHPLICTRRMLAHTPHANTHGMLLRHLAGTRSSQASGAHRLSIMVFQLQGTSRTQALPSSSSFPPSGRRSRSCAPRTCQRTQTLKCCTCCMPTLNAPTLPTAPCKQLSI